MSRGVALQPSNDDLRQAVARAHSWRGVLRELGYATTNGRTAALLRRRAELLDIDASHFRGARTWSDTDLRAAIQAATSWGSVLRDLGFGTGGGNVMAAIKARAMQLGLDYSHIERRQKAPKGVVPFTAVPCAEYLRSAGPTLAAGWFAHRGYRVSFPAEPCPYDLIVEDSGVLYRIQVKTTNSKDRTGAWRCHLAQNPKYRKTVIYDPDDVDFFFIITGDMVYYLTPVEEIAGLTEVSLNTLQHRKVSNLLMAA
jgi:PD-(D/E)XK endonuclease